MVVVNSIIEKKFITGLSNFYKQETSEEPIAKLTVEEEVRECLDEIIEKIVILKQEESFDSVSIHSNISIDSNIKSKTSLFKSQTVKFQMFFERENQDCIFKLLSKLFCQK